MYKFHLQNKFDITLLASYHSTEIPYGSCVLNDITTKRHCNQPLYKEDDKHICHYETKASDHPSCHKSECDEQANMQKPQPISNDDNKFKSQSEKTTDE